MGYLCEVVLAHQEIFQIACLVASSEISEGRAVLGCSDTLLLLCLAAATLQDFACQQNLESDAAGLVFVDAILLQQHQVLLHLVVVQDSCKRPAFLLFGSKRALHPAPFSPLAAPMLFHFSI